MAEKSFTDFPGCLNSINFEFESILDNSLNAVSSDLYRLLMNRRKILFINCLMSIPSKQVTLIGKLGDEYLY